MRYTFQQLLEFQNERNAECDESKVDAVVDYVLEELERRVKQYPMQKGVALVFFSKNSGMRTDSCEIDELTSTERNKIINTLSALGFNNVVFKNLSENKLIASTQLEISW